MFLINGFGQNTHKGRYKIKTLFAVRVVEHWHSLPGEIGLSILGDFQNPTGHRQGNLL